MTTETIENSYTETTETAGAETTIDPMRVLKVATTTSLSKKSVLGYTILSDDNNAIFLSLRSNSAAGQFSNVNVAFLDIANALVHADKITSSTLAPLPQYSNTSRNNAGFMLAVLLAEGLVCPSDRHYVRQDFKPFLQHIKSLIDAGVDLGDADEALQANADVNEADVPKADVLEVDAPVVMPAAKRGRPSKRA